MRTKLLILVSVVSCFLVGCDLKNTEQAKLQIKVDSLAALVADNQMMEQTLQEADALLDSIDASRDMLRTSMREGTSYEDFTSRIKEIGTFVKRSTNKINDLELALRTAKQSGTTYSARIKDLKESLEKSNAEIAALTETVTKYKGENESLVKTVDLQQAEISDKLSQIKVREEEIAQLEVRVNEILAQSRIDEAEAYFARGEALELAALRTSFLAPKKKKTTRQQALDMYRMAVLYGKNDAQGKVDELASKL
jgi:chromosome segregation ATPase